jgi:hypothetical protein
MMDALRAAQIDSVALITAAPPDSDSTAEGGN